MAVLFCAGRFILDFCRVNKWNSNMNVKFERNEYGLKLKLTASNDNERVLVDELFSNNPIGVKEKNLVVSAGVNSLEVLRPIYLNKSLVSLRGFSNYTGGNFLMRSGKGLFIFCVGGSFLFYAFDLVVNFQFDDIILYKDDRIEFQLNQQVSVTYLLSAAIEVAAPTTLKQLDELMTKY